MEPEQPTFTSEWHTPRQAISNLLSPFVTLFNKIVGGTGQVIDKTTQAAGNLGSSLGKTFNLLPIIVLVVVGFIVLYLYSMRGKRIV